MKNIVLATLISAAAVAASAQDVNIYSSRQPELIDPILAAFTAETGITANVVFLKKGMLERLRAEGARSPADVILTTDIANLDAMVQADLTQPVASEIINANIPASYRDADNQWFGLTSRARIIYASNERVAEGEITSYEQLADPEWAGRICVRSGTHDYNIALAAAYLLQHGEAETIAWLEGYKANLARAPQGNDRAQVKAIWAGECDIAIGNTYYMGKMLADPEQIPWASSVNLIFPSLNENGTHINLSGMAMTTSAPNKENAVLLMEFLTGDIAQSLYAEANFEYPLVDSVAPSALVAGWGEFTSDPTPLTDIARLRGAALRLVERVDFDG
ncbi:MAG TPA: Fe(3+) ABC transporter substrate-binding protein [Rhodobacteraceae bacterium]|nr:Fe(3+) ABC transporter substrate-binding protein [Paracoccaceae bacterium]